MREEIDDFQAPEGAVDPDPCDARPSRSLPLWSGFAHDLGNLLQTATSAVSIIDQSNIARPQQVRLAIASAKASLNHASELVRRIVSSAAGSPNPEGDTDVEACLAEIATVLGSALKSSIELEVVVDAGLPHLACDRVGLRNAILNLVFNARNAIPDDGRIAVHAHKTGNQAAITEVEIDVADDGIGMSAATIERAFEPHFTTKASGQGGIGLTTVEQFVKDAGGRIWIESEPGVGTIVRMRLPTNSPQHVREKGLQG